MSQRTLLDKVWDIHTVRELDGGQTQLFIGLHLIHDVTSAPAFGNLRERGIRVRCPDRTFATADHSVPTDVRTRPLRVVEDEMMLSALEENCRDFDITFFGMKDPSHGIVHVIGPELGLTQPGMTIACGDSHTSTHGAFGAVAFGIGTTQVEHVLATQTLALEKPAVRRVNVNGSLPPGVTAKDVILTLIGALGVSGGNGFAYEYGGSVVDGMGMDARMTLCNMTIEGGARVGYVNPDATTVEYLRGRPYAGSGDAFNRKTDSWLAFASDADAMYDDMVAFDANTFEPMVTWGTNPGQVVGVTRAIPTDANKDALEYMGLEAGQEVLGIPVNVAFLGSCTNGRITDLRNAAEFITRHRLNVHPNLRMALVVPGSSRVYVQAVEEGLDRVFRKAGFDFRTAGCSMCLAMNPDKLQGREICASSSNRNFKGRQGSAEGRTLLMSPQMVVAAAAAGKVVDIRAM